MLRTRFTFAAMLALLFAGSMARAQQPNYKLPAEPTAKVGSTLYYAVPLGYIYDHLAYVPNPGDWNLAIGDRFRDRVLLCRVRPLLHHRESRRDRQPRQRGHCRLEPHGASVQRLCGKRERYISRLPFLQHRVRAEELTLLHAVPGGVRRAAARGARPHHPAAVRTAPAVIDHQGHLRCTDDRQHSAIQV